MITALSASKYIYKLLKSSTALTALLSDNIYSVVSLEDCSYPFLVYERGNIQTVLTKDGVVKDTATVRIGIASDDYAQSVQIAETARSVMESAANITGLDFNVEGCSMLRAAEDYTGDAFVQVLEFELEFSL